MQQYRRRARLTGWPALALLLCACVSLIYIFRNGRDNPASNPTQAALVAPSVVPSTATPIPPTAIPSTATPIPPTPQTFNGSTQQAVGPFVLQPGLVIATMKHEGDRNFAVTILDAQGQPVDLLANVIGPFNGSQAFDVTGGKFALDIAANGLWSITLAQPAPPATLKPLGPAPFADFGPKATEFFLLQSGLTTFTMTHNGKGNFAVILLDQNGSAIDLLVNEIGSFDGSKATGILNPGAYLLNISADGDWTVGIKQ